MPPARLGRLRPARRAERRCQMGKTWFAKQKKTGAQSPTMLATPAGIFARVCGASGKAWVRAGPARGTDAMGKCLLTVLAVMVSASFSAAAQEPTIRVGWTIPAEESKYWLMRRPEQFPNLGKSYKIEFTQFQGTAPMVQAMVAGALECSSPG